MAHARRHLMYRTHLVSLPNGKQAAVTAEITLNDLDVAELISKAYHNKSRKSHAGPLEVKVTYASEAD